MRTTKKIARAEPRSAQSARRDERASTETLSGLRAEAGVVLAVANATKAKTRNAVDGEQPSSFRCKRERWRLTKGTAEAQPKLVTLSAKLMRTMKKVPEQSLSC